MDIWFFKSRFRDLYFIFQIPVPHDAHVNTFNFKWEKIKVRLIIFDWFA
jgi:hypothetical protein